MAAKPAPPRPATRIYLATPPSADIAALAAALPQLVASADIAAVLVKTQDNGERDIISRLKALAPAIQKSGAAMLADGAFELVARAGADGAHVSGIEAMQEALPVLKPARILGIGGLHTRHDAMIAGEHADYVLFGEPDGDGQRPSADAIAERVAWWAEVFEPPCVAYAASLDEARLFAKAGADFILAEDMIWQHAGGAQAALSALSAALESNTNKQMRAS